MMGPHSSTSFHNIPSLSHQEDQNNPDNHPTEKLDKHNGFEN